LSSDATVAIGLDEQPLVPERGGGVLRFDFQMGFGASINTRGISRPSGNLREFGDIHKVNNILEIADRRLFSLVATSYNYLFRKFILLPKTGSCPTGMPTVESKDTFGPGNNYPLQILA
jgi:hypothetical protein